MFAMCHVLEYDYEYLGVIKTIVASLLKRYYPVTVEKQCCPVSYYYNIMFAHICHYTYNVFRW